MRYLAGLDHYDQRRDPVDHVVDRVLPEDPAPVHAVAISTVSRHGRITAPAFLDSSQYEDGLCGRSVKVLLNVEFDPKDPDACPRCAEAHAQGATRPVGMTRSEREMAAWELSNWRAQQAVDSFDERHPEDEDLAT